jgi:hypothetical protein
MIRKSKMLFAALLLISLTACSNEIELPNISDASIVAGSQDTLFPWKIAVRDFSSKLSTEPGQTWEFDYELEVDLRRYKVRHGKFIRLIVAVFGALRYDQSGNYRADPSNFALSSNFTTTGIPIHNFDSWPQLRLIHGKNGSPFEGIEYLNFEPDRHLARRHEFSGGLKVKLPDNTPPGFYEPRMALLVEVEGVESPVYLDMFFTDYKDEPYSSLPLVAVGKSAAPRMPWIIFPEVHQTGRVGATAMQDRNSVGLNIRTSFPSELILRPGVYPLNPGLPEIFPRNSLPSIAGGEEVFPDRLDSYMRFDAGEVACRVYGPDGEIDLRTKRIVGEQDPGLALEGGPFTIDLSKSGHYKIHFQGYVEDIFGRRYEGGGDYVVHSAMPLTFSTSCKPGTSFLVGNGYPSKVNINPPIPAFVEVTVDYFPQSDTDRKRRWIARGNANRFGHFAAHEPAPLIFDEPGEYFSTVRATYTDQWGNLWMGEQSSAGVIAPVIPDIQLHGTRSYPHGFKPDEDHNGGVKRFKEQDHLANLFLFNKPNMPPEPRNPYHSRDTLFFTATGFNDIDLETLFSFSTDDKDLARRILRGNSHASVVLPAEYQPAKGPWRYLQNVILRGKANTVTWQIADPSQRDELPISSVATDPWHPLGFDQEGGIEAYVYTGLARPGFPALTSVLQRDGLGFYWCTNPNLFGHHINSGQNGDLTGDIYRVQAGLVVKDHEKRRNYYDAYGSVLVTVNNEFPSTSILEPGVRALIEEKGRKHFIFLATDTHDVLEVGEAIGVGGMVFPTVEADVKWTVVNPNGEETIITGRANRLGLVRGSRKIPVDRPGIYSIKVEVAYEGLTGDVVGTTDGTYWHCAVGRNAPSVFKTDLSPMSPVDFSRGVRIRFRWPDSLRNVTVHYGIMMPGKVLEQRTLPLSGNQWEYFFEPFQTAIQAPFLDVLNYSTGLITSADTVVFQFFFEAEDDRGPIFDSIRLVLRESTLMNFSPEQTIPAQPGGKHHGM